MVPSKQSRTFVELVPRPAVAHDVASEFELRLARGWRIGFTSGVDAAELRRVALALEAT
jgi:hypothetical protein